jgi:hypothetical protein
VRDAAIFSEAKREGRAQLSHDPVDALEDGWGLEHRCSLLLGQRLLALDAAVLEQRTVAVRIAPSSRSQTGNTCANLLQACHRPQAPLGHRNFQLNLDLGSRKKPSLGWVVCVSGIGGKEIGISHGVNEVYRRLHDDLDSLAGLLILNSDPAIDLDDGNHVVFVWPRLFAFESKEHCQFAFRRAASSCCARTDTASPATADPSGPSGARAAINARHAATLVDPGWL